MRSGQRFQILSPLSGNLVGGSTERGVPTMWSLNDIHIVLIYLMLLCVIRSKLTSCILEFSLFARFLSDSYRFPIILSKSDWGAPHWMFSNACHMPCFWIKWKTCWTIVFIKVSWVCGCWPVLLLKIYLCIGLLLLFSFGDVGEKLFWIVRLFCHTRRLYLLPKLSPQTNETLKKLHLLLGRWWRYTSNTSNARLFNNVSRNWLENWFVRFGRC